MKRLLITLFATVAIPAMAMTPEEKHIATIEKCDGREDIVYCFLSEYEGANRSEADYLIYHMVEAMKEKEEYELSVRLRRMYESFVEFAEPHEALETAIILINSGG